MKNKILAFFILLVASATMVNAASYNVRVVAMDKFSTNAPSKVIAVKVLEAAQVGNYSLRPNDTLYCDVVKVTDPKRGKRAATFSVHPDYYLTGDETVKITEPFNGKYASKIISKDELKNVDPLQVGKKAAVTVGNHFVKGLAPAVTLAEGMIENEEGNRIESGVKNVYKNSPLSYVEKGQELVIEPGDSFYLIFKPSKNDADTEE